MLLEEILAGESEHVEYKEDIPSKSEKYMKTVVAFANGTGGRLIFGVENGTWKASGFTKETVFEKMDAIANAIFDSCEPNITPNVAIQELDGRAIIIVDILPGMQKPYYIRRQGMLDDELTIEKMKSGFSKVKNRGIAAAFSYMNIIEAWGSGIPKMFRDAKAYGLPEPELIDLGSDFRVNLYRKQVYTDNLGVLNPELLREDATDYATKYATKYATDYATKYATDLTMKERQIINVICKKPNITQKQIHEETGISLGTVKRILPRLQEIGKLKRIGNRRSGQWKVL